MPLCFVGFDKDVRPTKIKLYTHIMRHHAVPLTALWRFWRFSAVANARNTTRKKLETLVSDNDIAGKTRNITQTYPSPTTICKSRGSLGRPSRKKGMARNEHRKKACCRCNELGNSEIQLTAGRPATMVAWASSTQQEGLQRAELLVYHGGRRARPICGFRGRWT